MKLKTKENIAAVLKILLGLCYIFPLIIALLFSIQPNEEVGMAPLRFFSENPTIQNYFSVWESTPILTYFKNTFIMVIVCVPFQLLFASTSAFAFTFYDFKGKEFLFTLFLTTMMIPGEVTLISNYATIQNMGLYNTYAAITITSLVNVGATFMLRQHMRSLPKELWEAAKMDGCKEMKYFVSVVLPLSVPILSAQGITSFIHVYNQYFWPMLVTNGPEMRTIQVGMAQLMASGSTTYGSVLAGAILCMLIPMFAYIFGQEHIVKGLTAGAVKN